MRNTKSESKNIYKYFSSHSYEHPYKVELDLYEPPQHFIEPDPHPPTFPPTLEETKLTFIETEEQVDELVLHLETVEELAVDVEHHSYRTYQGMLFFVFFAIRKYR